MTSIPVERRMSYEEVYGHPICGQQHPEGVKGNACFQHVNGEPIFCTYLPNHLGPYHHHDGYMSCYAWLVS
jgi:hypothetical protein